MSENQLNLSDNWEPSHGDVCYKHSYAKESDFIEILIKGVMKKYCRFCHYEKEERRKENQQEWEKHKKLLSDYYIRKKIALSKSGLKMHEIPEDVVEAKRASLQLQNYIEELKKPLKECHRHGKLYEGQVNKSGMTKSGRQLYKCRECQHELHRNYYLLNKAKISIKTGEWRRANKDRKNALNKKYRNTAKGKINKNKHERFAVKKLSDWYVKGLITRRSFMRREDVPAEMIAAKRINQFLKREIKLQSTKGKK